MVVDEILVAAQLRGMVASYRMQIIGGARFVECVGGQVEYAEVLRVLKKLDFVVGLTEIRVVVFLANPVRVAEIALVHRPHISDDQHTQDGDQHAGFQFAAHVQHHRHRRQHNQQERAPCVRGQHRSALVAEGFHEPGRHAGEGAGVVRTREAADRAAEDREEQAQARRNAGCYPQRADKLLAVEPALEYLAQCHEAQQRHRDFSYHQY